MKDSEANLGDMGIGSSEYSPPFIDEFRPFSDAIARQTGKIMEETNDFELIIKVSKMAILLDPENYFAMYTLGSMYISKNQNREALEVIEKGLKVNPKFSALTDLLANYYLVTQQFDLGFLEIEKIDFEKQATAGKIGILMLKCKLKIFMGLY